MLTSKIICFFMKPTKYPEFCPQVILANQEEKFDYVANQLTVQWEEHRCWKNYFQMS